MLHAIIKPRVNEEKCEADGICAEWCPSGAITVEDIARIDLSTCIGCGECAVTDIGILASKDAVSIDHLDLAVEENFLKASSLNDRAKEVTGLSGFKFHRREHSQEKCEDEQYKHW